MGKRYPQTIREKAKQNKKIHRPRNLNWHKPSASIFPLAQQKWAADLRQWEWVCITPCSKKNFSEHFVGKKLLTQERRINRDCSNPCYKWDGPSFSPSCIAGTPPRELFWTQRFSRAWCTNHVTQITGSCIKCSVSIFLQESWKFPCLVQNRIPWCSAILFLPRPGCWTNPSAASSPRWYHLLTMRFGIEMPCSFSFCLPALSPSSSQGLLFSWELNLTEIVIKMLYMLI